VSMFTKNDQGADRSQPTAEAPQVAPHGAQDVARAPSGGQIVSVISRGLTVTGNLESEGAIQVDGKIEGDVRGQTVTIGEGAVIKGAVYGDSVKVAGTIQGKIEAQTVAIASSGRMEGDIIHERLEIQSGAHVDGHCQPTYNKASGKVTPITAASDTAKASATAPGKVVSGDT
jgi:cytoskeletal protein CcmA (bactofilin family)